MGKITYKDVDELPDLTKEPIHQVNPVTKKVTTYKSVDELPDLKKKAKTDSNVTAKPSGNGLSNTQIPNVNLFGVNNAKQESVLTPDFKPVPTKLEGFKNADFASRRLVKGTPAYKEKVKEIQSESVLLPKLEPSLNEAEDLLHTKLGGKMSDPTTSKTLEQEIISERKNPAVQYELGESYLNKMGLKEGEDVINFYHNKKSELEAEKEKVQNEYDTFYSNTVGSRGSLVGKENADILKNYENTLEVLNQKIKTFDKFSGVVNAKKAIDNTPLPNDDKDVPNYFQTIGAKVNSLSNPDALKTHEEDMATNAWGAFGDTKDIRNYDNEMTGIITKQNDLVRQVRSNEISKEDYEAQSKQLEEYANIALDRHVGAKMKVYGKALGQIIDKKRESNSSLSNAWNNIFSATPSKEEAKKAIDELKKNGATFTPKEEQFFLDNPNQIQGTAILPTYVFKTADGFAKMINPLERLLGVTENEQRNRQEVFERNFTVNPNKAFEQPETIIDVNKGDTFLKDIENPKAGELNWGYGTGQGVANAMATVTNFIVANKGFGALAKASGLGKNATLIASNVASNTALTYDDAIKTAETFTKNKNEQKAYALITGVLGGLLFAKLDPEGIVKKAFTNPSKETVQSFLSAIPKEGIKAMSKEKVGEFILNTAKKAIANNVSASTILTANEIKDVVVESLFNPKTASKHDFDIQKTLAHNAITFGALSLLHGIGGARSDVAKRDAIRQSAFEASKDIPSFERDLKLAVDNKKITEAEANEKLRLVNDIAEIRNSKDIPANLSLKNQARYAVNLLNEKQIQSDIEGITDKVQIDRAKEEINQLQEERKSLIENPSEPIEIPEAPKVEGEPENISQPIELSVEEKPSTVSGSALKDGNGLNEDANKILGLHDNGVNFDLFDNNKLRQIAKDNGIDLPEGTKNADIIEALKKKQNASKEQTQKAFEDLTEADIDKLSPSEKAKLYKENGITNEDGSEITEKDIKDNPLQYSYDFMASSNSGKWNSANSELESAVQGNKKQYSLYKLMAGEFDTFKEFVDFINSKNYGDKIEYTERMRRADETMTPEERKSAIDSYNKSAESNAGDKAQKGKDVLKEHGFEDEKEYSPQEIIDRFPLKGVQKIIYDIIKNVADKLGIKVKFSSSRITEGFEGSNNPLNGEILISPHTLNNGRIGEVLVHEVVHALTTKIISRVNSGVETGLTSKQVAAVKGLKKLYDAVRNDNKLENKYPVKDIFEFIAHLTNDNFVKELESKDRNFLQKVVDFIADILGIGNANELAKKYLKDIISDGTFLEKEGVTVKSSDYGANKQGSKLSPKQQLLEKIRDNSKQLSEKYHSEKENDIKKIADKLFNRKAPLQYTEAATPAKKESGGVSGSALKDVGKSVIGSDVDLKGNKKEVWMSPFDVSVFNTGKKRVTLNFLNREFRIQSENGNIELDELTAKGKAKHFNQKVDLTPDELAEYNSIQKDISENGTTRENNKRSNDLTNKIIDRLNIGNEVEKLGQNKNQQVVEIKNALDAGEYQKAIADGKMTSADAKKIIESAGFEVPKEILEAQAPTQYTEAATPAKKESGGVSGSALKDVPTSLRGVKYSDIVIGDKHLEDILDENKLSDAEKDQVREIFSRGVDYFKFDKEGEQKFQEKFSNPEDITDVADITTGVSAAQQSAFNFHNTKNYDNVKDAVNYIASNPNDYSPKVVKAVKEIKEKLDNPSSSMNRIYAIDVMKELGIKAPTQYTEAATPAKKESGGVSGSALKDVVPVFHHTKVDVKDFDFGNFQRGKNQVSQFGDGLAVSTDTTPFLQKRYGNPIKGEVKDSDFVVIDTNKTEKEIYEELKSKGYKFNKPDGGSYIGNDPAKEYDGTEKANEQPAIISLFNDFQKSNPEVKGVKIVNHIIANEKVSPFYVIYDNKSFYGEGSLKAPTQYTEAATPKSENKPIQNEGKDNEVQQSAEVKEPATTEPNKEIESASEGTGGKEPPNKDFDKMTSNIPSSGEVKKYLSGETILENQPNTELRNPQEYVELKLNEALKHGVETIEKAKEIFGNEYVEKTLEYIEKNNLPIENKSLLYVTLENEMAKRVAAEPNNVGLKKIEDLVRSKSQAFLRSNSKAINMGRLRAFAKTGFDISKITDKFFSSKELENKKEVEKILQSDADTIQKQYEENKQSESDVSAEIEAKIKAGIESEVAKLFEAMPKSKKDFINKTIAKLEATQKKLRSKSYSDATGMIAMVDAGITTIKTALKAGLKLSDAIEVGIRKIKEQLGGEWKKEDEFRKDMHREMGVKEKGEKTVQERIADAENRIQKQIDSIRDEIIAGERKKVKSRIHSDRIERLKEQKKMLEELRDKYLPKEKDKFEQEKAVGSAVKKLEKENADLDRQIKKGEKDKLENKKSVESDAIDRLKDARDAKREVLEAIDPTPKQYIENALIEQGFGKTIKIKTKNGVEERQVLDWKKLAGEEGSVDKISDNVGKVLEKNGFTPEQLGRMSDAFIKEYTDLRASVIEKGLNEMASRNKTTVSPLQKSAAKKLAEMYNYGLFEKDPVEFETTLAKTIGIDRLNEGRVAKVVELGNALSKMYSTKFQGQKLAEPQLRTAIQVVEEKMRQILQEEATKHGSTPLKLADITRTFMDAVQRMTLNNLKQAFENPLSGRWENIFSTIGTKGSSTKELNVKNRQDARALYKEMILQKGIHYGDVASTFVSKGNLESIVNKLPDNKLLHATVSTALGRTTLDAVDSFYKAKITQQKFIHNLVQVLTKDRLIGGKVEKGMSKEEAKKYVAEKLTGQSFKEAQETAKDLIDSINNNADKKIFNDSPEFVDRLANDIVTASLVNGEKITQDMVTASYNAAYKAAGRGLGHVANNFISQAVGTTTGKIESRINEAIKEKEYNKAAALTVLSIFYRNIANPFVGGGTNWVVLKAEKSGLGLVSGLGSMMMKGKKMDLTSDAGIRQLENAMYENLKVKDKFIRGAVGGAVTALTALAYAGIASTDDYRKWRKDNMWAARYLDVITPEIILGTMAKKDEKMKRYLESTFNQNEQFDKSKKVIKSISSLVKGDTKAAAGQSGEVLGGIVGAPVPWRLVRDGQQIYQGVTGKDVYKVDNRPSQSIMEGYFKGGLVDYLGFAPEQEYSNDIKNYKQGGREITKEENKDFETKRDAEVKRKIDLLKQTAAYKDLPTDEDKKKAEASMKASITESLKKEMFGEKKMSRKEERIQRRLKEAKNKISKQ